MNDRQIIIKYVFLFEVKARLNEVKFKLKKN